MKLLSPNELIEVLPPEPGVVDAGVATFETSAASMLFQKPGAFRHMISEGWTLPEVVKVNSVPAYLLCYHIAPDGGMWIDVIQSLRPGLDPNAMYIGAEIIAARRRAPYIRFFTKRRGLARYAQDNGFVTEGVMMTKGRA